MHAFLIHLASGVDPVPRIDCITFLGVDQEVTVHLLHSLFFVPYILYSKNWRLFTRVGGIPGKGLPLVVEIQG